MMRFRDSEEMSLALKHTNVSAMQVSRGEFLATWMHLNFCDWSVQSISFEQGHSVCSGDAPQDHHAFVIPLAQSSGFRLLGCDVSDTNFAVYAPGSEHTDSTTSGCREVVLVAPASFDDVCEIEGRMLPRFGSHVTVGQLQSLSRLKAFLRHLDQSITATPPVASARALADALTRLLADALPHQASGGAVTGRPKMPRSAILKKIAAILDANDGQPIYAGELARAVGISQASLQRVFHELFGMPPARYLLLRRFYIARKRLRSKSADTVTEVASELGFWDHSRFSRTYRQLFREAPSETLRR